MTNPYQGHAASLPKHYIIHSTRKTAAQAQLATVIRLFPKYAVRRAAPKPAAAESRPDVEYKIAGKVMAASVAYGT